MAHRGNYVGVITHITIQSSGHLFQQCGEKVDIFGKDSGILHTQKSGAAQLFVLNIQVQLPAAFGLARIVPVNISTAFTIEGDRNDGPLRVWVGLEAVNRVGNFGRHAIAVVTLMYVGGGEGAIITQ
jgi:hypothetical protein